MSFNLRSPKLMSHSTCPIGSILFPLAHESHIPVHICILLVLCNFSNEVLLITNLKATVSQGSETCLFLITACKLVVYLPSM